jgi:hypothetical protein
MAVLALAALIAWWWRRDHRRREAKVARLVAEARLAGRAESASGAAPITRRTLAGACALVAAGALAIGPAGAASAVPDDPNRRGSVLIRVYVAPEAPAPSPPPDQDGLAGTGARVAGLALGALGGVGLGLAIGAARRRSSGTA